MQAQIEQNVTVRRTTIANQEKFHSDFEAAQKRAISGSYISLHARLLGMDVSDGQVSEEVYEAEGDALRGIEESYMAADIPLHSVTHREGLDVLLEQAKQRLAADKKSIAVLEDRPAA